MLRYYKLFDLMNRKNIKKNELRELLSSRTVAKLSKGENMNTDAIDKICKLLQCQPGDIMEYLESDENDTLYGEDIHIQIKNEIYEISKEQSIEVKKEQIVEIEKDNTKEVLLEKIIIEEEP